MEGLDINQLWRQIPPEEKFEIMALSHSKGTAAAVTGIIIGMTVAVCFKQPWLIWGSLLLCPIVFDAASVKAWKHLKPRVILEYLAARAAARRFAFSINSSKLGIAAIVRAELKEIKNLQPSDDEQEPEIDLNSKPVWVTLFHDALIVISEQAGGAKLELGQLLVKNLEVHGDSPSGQGEYAPDRNLVVGVTGINGNKKTFSISSKHPAALVVLEKKLHKLTKECKESLGFIKEAVVNSEQSEDDIFDTRF